jgi:hypothetical protein
MKMKQNMENKVKKEKWETPRIFSLTFKKTAGGHDRAQNEDTTSGGDLTLNFGSN